ncbi:AAA family ATPase [Desulfonatronum thioautotrophicum]|uniref:AAA family ATPase n=1 Tax=Desulfonatronum thioautotrophicum TaxID=617001 RepID=UPI0005EB7D61|nr:AAA family ATPase [Desulfonatronum thioautotrophicum]
MSITSITIQNFKGIKDKTTVHFKPITLLFGPNSAGKSTIIQALHYIKQVFVNRNLDADVSFAYDGEIRSGGFEHIITSHDFSKEMILGICINKYHNIKESEKKYGFNPLIINELIEHEKEIYVELYIIWDSLKMKPIVKSYSLFIGGMKVLSIEYILHSNLTKLVYFNIDHFIFEKEMLYRYPEFIYEFKLDEKEKYTYKTAFEKIFNDYFNNKNHIYDYDFLQHAVDCALPKSDFNSVSLKISDEEYEIDDDAMPMLVKADPRMPFFEGIIFKKLLKSYGLVKNELIDNLRIGPLRSLPLRLEENQVPRQDRFITGKAAWNILFGSDEDFIKKFNYWINERLETGYKAKIIHYKEVESRFSDSEIDDDLKDVYKKAPIKKKLIFISKNNNEVMLQDVGFGFSQILPVIVATLMSKKETSQIYFRDRKYGDFDKGIISIEQPELHIHPKLQVELGDLFIEQSKKDKVIFLIETHSEHLLLRILRRIRETTNGTLAEGLTPIQAEDVSVKYVENIEMDGYRRSVVREMPLNKQGELVKAWPGGFFEEGLREVF